MPLDRLRAAVVAYGLDPPSVPLGRIDEPAFKLLLKWAADENLTGLLWHAARATAELTSEQILRLDHSYADAAMSVLPIEASAIDVAKALATADIEFRVLKGLATSRLLYAHAGWRAFRDLDIVVRPSDLQRSLAALEATTASGAEIQAGPVRTAMMKEQQITDLRGVAIDVHRAVQGSLITASLAVDDVFVEPQEFRIGDMTLLAPSPEVMLVHAVLHSSSAGVQLSTLPDIGRLSRLVPPSAVIGAGLLRDRSVGDLFNWSLERAAAIVPLPAEWTEHGARHRPRDRTRRLLDLAHRNDARLGLANVLIGGQRVRRSLEVLWPTNQYLSYHEISRLDNVRWIAQRSWQVITRGSSNPMI